MARKSLATGNYLKRSGTPPLSGSNGPFTISFWFAPNNLTQAQGYICQGGSSGTQFGILWEDPNNSVRFYTNFTGTNPSPGSAILLGDTLWHHIAYKRATAGTSEWAFFLDGRKTVISSAIDWTFASFSDGFGLFAAVNVPTDYCLCSLAEFAIWDNRIIADAAVHRLAAGLSPLKIRPLPNYFWEVSGRSQELSRVGPQSLSLTGTLPPVALPPVLSIVRTRKRQTLFRAAVSARPPIYHLVSGGSL